MLLLSRDLISLFSSEVSFGHLRENTFLVLLISYPSWYNWPNFFREAREYGRYFVNVNITQEPGEVSMLWFLWYVAACDKSKRIQEVENGGQVSMEKLMTLVSVSMEQVSLK